MQNDLQENTRWQAELPLRLFNTRMHKSLLYTKESYSGKAGAVAFLSWKDTTEQLSEAPGDRPWVCVGQGGFLSLLLALGHG